MGTTTHYALPDSQWVELRDPRKVPERLRRPVRLAALALTRTIPEDRRKPVIKVSEEPEQTADEETQAAFGAPPIEALVEEAKAEEETIELPTDEQQCALDTYNEALLFAVIVAWSYPDEITLDSIRNLDGDVYDELVKEVRRLNQGDESEEQSLDSDPTSP
jgi:hypothetical protein